MEIVINGTVKSLHSEPEVTLKRALEQSGHIDSMDGIAVAVNDTVVPKNEWEKRKLEQGDHVEVIKAVQGG